MAAIGQFTRIVLVRPFERFFRLEAAGSIVLLLATIAALTWANSPGAASYARLWETKAIVGIGPLVLDKALILWVNDGLMAVFFLLVGLEIKREFLTGQLSNPRAAALPAIAALGGMLVPALIYVAFNAGGAGAAGWGIPMATDIAFALGALALLGRRLPPSLRIFLAAAAIVDDLGAVLVIAIFYTPHLSLGALAVAAVALGALVMLNRLGVRSVSPYMLVGIVLWVAVLKSGVHATIAGVLLAFTIPARPRAIHPNFVAEAQRVLGEAPRAAEIAAAPAETRAAAAGEREAVLLTVQHAAAAEEAPLTRVEHALVPWVAFGIMPLFAFANAGVSLSGGVAALASPVALGVILGLLIGKQIGFMLFPYLAVRTGVGALPAGASWRHMYGVSILAGIGFTMSLFIAGLGLPEDLLDEAKIGILAASVIAGVAGLLALSATAAPRAPPTRA